MLLVQSICESGDKGNPVALDDSSPVSLAFLKLAENVAQQVAIRNVFVEATQRVIVNE
jgi:ATP-binding protein involved in chromosome partitioning